ncbi:MAG: c-type cytochrome, partial [Bacteroidia bacterium]|nr:c-type cytochrome [Bacteroidia bacterium]
MVRSRKTNNQGNNFNYRPIKVNIILAIITVTVFLLQTVISCSPENQSGKNDADTSSVSIADLFTEEQVWIAPDSASIPQNDEGKIISYGRRLVIHTSKYFGPKGSIMQNTNGMNCQNCHLDAGTRPHGNNFGAVASTYPKIAARFGGLQTIATKVNDCFERSMNGEAIDTNSKVMNAIIAYLKWLGKDVKKGETPAGSGGINAPHFISRAADPEKGKLVYDQFCSRCHGKNGEGQFVVDVLKDETKQQGGSATTDDLYYYPPLWGAHSFNAVATLYRLSKFAGFVQSNMPYPMTYKNFVLTDEQAWDVAAYVNSLDRPIKDHSKDYVIDISKKPYDFPFGPFADNFSETQHKFGPYT